MLRHPLKEFRLRLTKLEENYIIAVDWSENNYLKINCHLIVIKCHLLISGNKFENLWAKIGDSKL